MNMRKYIYATIAAVVVMFMASMTVAANSPGNVDDLSAAEQYNYTVYTGQIGPYPITLYIDLSASVNEYLHSERKPLRYIQRTVGRSGRRLRRDVYQQ